MKRKNKLDYLRLSETLGSQLFYFDKVDSTMNEARNLINNHKLKDGAIILAETQSGGKGRRGRAWDSPKGGVWLTYVITPFLDREQYPLYTLMSAVAITELLIGSFPCQIKWPNDIILHEKKLCGIAVDLVVNRKDYLSIGIGINVYNEVIDTGIKIADFKRLDINDLVINLVKSLENYKEVLEATPHKILDLWRKYNNTLDNEVIVYPADKSAPYRAKALDIAPDGSLIVQSNGELKNILAADVSLRVKRDGENGN